MNYYDLWFDSQAENRAHNLEVDQREYMYKLQREKAKQECELAYEQQKKMNELEYEKKKHKMERKQRKQKVWDDFKQKLLRLIGIKPEMPYQLSVSKDDAFLNFLKFAQEQLEKFSSYSCKNDKALQRLLDETFNSISRLTTKLDSDNYTIQGISQFYNVELEQFFNILGEGPNFTINKELYEKLCSCLKSIKNKATKLEKSISDVNTFTISVKFDALIDYIDN